MFSYEGHLCIPLKVKIEYIIPKLDGPCSISDCFISSYSMQTGLSVTL